jgi:S-methylmethionine-dependent homocysteine/selenocysteine methylase
VDLILIETMNKIDEARAALCAARETKLPVWCSFVCDEDGNLLSGETFPEAVRAIQPLEPDAILVNCTSLAGMKKVMNFFIQDSSIKYYGAYANICRINVDGGVILSDDVSPTDYLNQVQEWVSLGAKIVGGCCGTMPEHIGALRKLKEEKFEYRKPKS